MAVVPANDDLHAEHRAIALGPRRFLRARRQRKAPYRGPRMPQKMTRPRRRPRSQQRLDEGASGRGSPEILVNIMDAGKALPIER